MDKTKMTREDVADNLLWGLWRCIEDSYKDKYFKDVWANFENAIRSASYTDNIAIFLDNIKTRIPITMELQYLDDIKKVIDENNDEEILGWIRNESMYMMMLVRIRNQERKELFNNK